jgi:glycosyltransferase involved in cell wall biosynthesis
MRVAIITPAFNAAPYIGDTIRSVLAQTHSDWRMVIVDDGSTDATAQVAARFADPRLTVISRPNQGVSAARNHGLTLADGEAVQFLDADDQLAQDALARLTEALSANPWAGAAAGAYRRVGGDHPAARSITPPGEADLFPLLLIRNHFINGGQILLRRSVVDRAGGFRTDLSFGEDWEYWVRVAAFAAFVTLPEPDPVLFALARDEGAYRRHVTDPARLRQCLDIIHTHPALCARWSPTRRNALRRHADAEACWVLARERLRLGQVSEARFWLRAAPRLAPTPRVLLRALSGFVAPVLPPSWRGPLRPYTGRGLR